MRVERKGAAQVRAGYTRFETALAEADVLSLHLPLNDDTRGLIGAAELALMKPDALLINTARGGLVDEAALLAALQAGRLGGAGLDVLDTEPPRQGNPLLDVELPNLIITPHANAPACPGIPRKSSTPANRRRSTRNRSTTAGSSPDSATPGRAGPPPPAYA